VGKIISLDELILQRPQWKADGRRLVFVAGCFDLLHPGHIRLLEQARDHGELLVVGVLSDASVIAEAAAKTEAPGKVKRPITCASERCEILAALAMVDYAFEFSDCAVEDVLNRLGPDAVIEGSDPSGRDSAVRKAAIRAGLDVVRIPLEPGHSTSLLIERITQLHT